MNKPGGKAKPFLHSPTYWPRVELGLGSLSRQAHSLLPGSSEVALGAVEQKSDTVGEGGGTASTRWGQGGIGSGIQ